MASARSQYFAEIPANAKARYVEKIALCDGVDPYASSTKYEDDISKWPAVSYPDIVNYLVLSTSFATGKQMKAYKSLESYNYFVSGWVDEVTVSVTTSGSVGARVPKC